MALSEAQKASVRLYLGWPDRFHQVDTRLEMALSAVDTRPDTQTLIETELADLSTLDAAMKSARTRFVAASVGEIHLQAADELGLLRSQARQSAGRIASLLGVTIRHDAFSGAGPSSFAGWADGNELPQG